MKHIFVVLLFLLPAVGHAQSPNDLAQIWLAQHGLAAAPGDYATCQPEGGADGICAWDIGKLGAQPSTEQLDALAPTWQTMRQAAEADAIIKAGLAVASTGTPALSGRYPVDGAAQFNITAELMSITVNNVFTNGQATKLWPDMTGTRHSFTITQFKAFATALGGYVDAVLDTVDTLKTGQAASWPAASATIP